MTKRGSGELPNSPRVLIVEDEFFTREFLSICLEKSGYQVVSCSNGADALAILKSGSRDNLLCVITDIQMPKMDGLELLQAIRSNQSLCGTTVIAFTANEERLESGLEFDSTYIKPDTKLLISGLKDLRDKKTIWQ